MMSLVFIVTGCAGFIAAPAPRIVQARHSLLTRVPPPALLPMLLPPTATRMSGAADDEARPKIRKMSAAHNACGGGC